MLFRGQSTFILDFHRRQRFDYSPHDDVIKWKKNPRYWPFVRGTHRSPVNSPHKGQWHGALIFSLICPLNTRLSKQSWGWWFETPSPSLWRHCNDSQYYGCDASSQAINSQAVDLVWPEYSVFSTRGLKIFHDIYLSWLCEEVQLQNVTSDQYMFTMHQLNLITPKYLIQLENNQILHIYEMDERWINWGHAHYRNTTDLIRNMFCPAIQIYFLKDFTQHWSQYMTWKILITP